MHEYIHADICQSLRVDPELCYMRQLHVILIERDPQRAYSCIVLHDLHNVAPATSR